MLATNDKIITSKYLNTLDEELRELVCYLDSLYYNKIIDNPLFTKINLTDERSIFALHELASFLYKKFYTASLHEAFKISDNYKYSKMIEVSNNLLLFKDKKYLEVFEKLVHYNVYNTDINEYIKLINFLNKMYRDSKLEDKIFKFTTDKENKYVLNRQKKEPITLEQEFKNLKEILNNKTNADYKKFLKEKNISCDTKDMRQDYIYKKIGNIGELYTLNFLLSEKFNVRYVAQDISDNLGFDFLALGRNSEEFPEILVDSKATINEKNEYFSMTPNEFRVLDSSDQNNQHNYPYHYFISRVFINIEKETMAKHQMLAAEMCNPNIFKGVYDESLEYEINNSKSDDKKKVYSYKQKELQM